MSKIFLMALSIIIVLGAVSVPNASACGTSQCYTTHFTGELVRP